MKFKKQEIKIRVFGNCHVAWQWKKITVFIFLKS